MSDTDTPDTDTEILENELDNARLDISV